MSLQDEAISIIKDAYKNDNNVEVDNKKIVMDNEEIYYQGFPLSYSEGTYYANDYLDLKEMYDYTKNGKKCFAFGKTTQLKNVIFSLEIGEIDKMDEITKGNKNIQFEKMDFVREKIDGTDQKIVRFKKPVVNNDGDTYTVYWVAIKIGKEGNRDYTALKDYIVASDNRTYNKVVRNMIEYIEVENREVPKNKTKLPFNLLVSGAPGTGKSHFCQKRY